MKPTNIKGKVYYMVAQRVLEFHRLYSKGRIETELISSPDAERIVFKAKAIPDVSDPERYFTGYSQAKWSDRSSLVNSQSALENAETSAVGRALGFLGIGVVDDIASGDEINKGSVDWNVISELYDLKKDVIPPDAVENVKRVIEKKEVSNYWKLKKYLAEL